MKSESLKQNLDVIRDYISGIKGLAEDKEVQLLRSQLRVLERTIKQFEKDGLKVPEGVLSDKFSLESKIKEIKGGPQEISLLYEELLGLIIQIARLLRKRPDRDFRHRLRELRKCEVPKDVLRNNIIGVLKEMGGRGNERDVLKAIEERLKEQFTDADLDKPYGRRTRWEMNARHERNLMIKEGVLTPDSDRRKWTLMR